ncbi:MAG: NAD(P)/FAD-dependent oxidoreductase, partial [Christensenellales bacterium]
MQTDCVILGGGAGGLCAAAALGRRRLHVTVVERLPRVGKKLLATGNGRCNLSNLDMQAAHYGKAAPFVEQMYAVTPPSEVAAFFSSLGLMTAVEDDRVYPRTMAASAVLDVLRMACERTSVTLLTDTEAVALTPSRRGGWSVQLADGSG